LSTVSNALRIEQVVVGVHGKQVLLVQQRFQFLFEGTSPNAFQQTVHREEYKRERDKREKRERRKKVGGV